MNTSERVSYIAYYGTSNSNEADGIYTQFLEYGPLVLEEPKLESLEAKAGFLKINRAEDLLFSIVMGPDGSGHVKSFRRDRASGGLTLISEQAAGGGTICHLNLDRSERWLFGTSYGDAVVTVFPVDEDGSIGERSQSFELEGEGSKANPERQQRSHAHSIYADPTNRFVFVCDLGMDRIYVYDFDSKTGSLTPAKTPFVETAPGAGPRHLAFHGNGRWVYAINELNGTITQYEWSADLGQLRPLQTVDTLPSDFSECNICAEVLLHPSNRFLYGSNRGHDSIVAYSVDKDNGSLELIQRISSGGEHPRNFTLDDQGRFLAVANKDSDNIVYFEIDPQSGELSELKRVEGVPGCTCVRIFKVG